MNAEVTAEGQFASVTTVIETYDVKLMIHNVQALVLLL